MSDIAGRPGFEDAFHKAAERHERAWVFVTLVMLMGILACTMYFVVYDYGVVVRTAAYRSDPTALGGPAPGVVPAADAGLVRTGPNSYAVHMVAHMWGWTPSPLHVPEGATVTFYVTSIDVLHGFEVKGTTINVTAVPGITGEVTYTFKHAGTLDIVCNEYCGIEHQAMLGRIIVDPKSPA